MFWQVLSIESTKIFKRRLFWVMLALTALFVMLIQIVLYVTLQDSLNGAAMPAEERLMAKEIVTWPGALVHLLSITAGNNFGGLFLVILVGAVTAQEYTWRTLHQWLGRGIPRLLLGSVKFTTILFSALLIVLTALVAGGIITAITSIQVDGSLHLDQLNFLQLLLSVLRTTFTLLPYGALAFLLAVASRSTVVAISGSLAYVLLFENLLMQVLGLLGEKVAHLARFSPAVLADSLLVLNQAATAGEITLPDGAVSPWVAALGITAWALLFLGLSLWIFQKQDLAE